MTQGGQDIEPFALLVDIFQRPPVFGEYTAEEYLDDLGRVIYPGAGSNCEADVHVVASLRDANPGLGETGPRVGQRTLTDPAPAPRVLP